MTLDECEEYLPHGWTERIRRDPLLWEIFEDHEYELEMEAVPPFLIQALRGGNLDHLRPILALYGPPGLALLENLKAIDAASQDTASITTPDGQTAYAGYFFARFPGIGSGAKGFLDGLFAKTKAERLAREYVAAIRRVYAEIFQEPAPIDASPGIEFLSGEEGYRFQEQMHKDFVANRFHPTTDIYMSLGHLDEELEYQGNCQELADALSEALYHINNDYLLSCFLRWPLLKSPPVENPLQPYFELWKMGLEVEFPERDRVVLIA
ncbi:MAG: hypothetical protein HFF50_08090 [Lawsonibacter sp.]|nr:hypothetical protein [Lawsonibacter sp.]